MNRETPIRNQIISAPCCLRENSLKLQTLNQLAKSTFQRLAHDFSKNWIPVTVRWAGYYVPEGTEDKLPEGFIPGSGMKVKCSFPDKPEKNTEYKLQCTIFGWSYREGFKEGVLTSKEKVFKKNFKLFWFIPLFPIYATRDRFCTLGEIIASLTKTMPHLSHFAVYKVNEQEEEAEFELYTIPKSIFEFN